MRLYVETMDATVVEVSDDGRVQIENEGWTTPTLQERRAIIYAAQTEMGALQDAVRILESASPTPPSAIPQPRAR
jgi:hypothetical protein